MSMPCFIHVDLDAFFASVEQLDNPEYRGKPVIVGGLPTDRRGVVSTCSYEARKYGVHSAMPVANAYKLCPQGIYVRGRMDRYQEKSREVMNVFTEFSPDIQQMSIDEAFIDITGTERLFGSPENVANMLKKRVLERTQLTVSVGVASTKYIAKISSGMSKPDGLFIVETGKEEEFMLSLPLKKVWGIGEKTLAKINNAGFYTTSEIHNASETLLKTLLGNASGTFLYNAVRGISPKTFSDKPKSRSISSEKTFSFDLIDKYVIETALMELSWDVMYRLFTEKLTSKTAQLKIRYEDFTTITVQETSTWNITSADDLFSRIKKLFDKKYENGRGIRLLGIATQNIENNTTLMQKDLFEFEDEKKAILEKTVIEIQKKNPNIQLKKARLLKTFSLTFFLLLSQFFPTKLQAEDPVAIFSITPNSPDIEFYAEGSWEAKLLTQFDLFSNTATNNTLGINFNPPIFIQKTDLSVWFLLLNKWYFEANIADDFLESTVAAGYQGNGYLKHARIGNRHINFPQFYGINDINRGIGNGSKQAPGIMAEFSDSNWRADAILRYDMTEPLEKTWIGNNELSESNIKISSWEKGARFILPENTVEHITNIFLETDTQEYKKLSPSEYLIIPSKNMIIFNTPQKQSILATFSTKPNLGAYSTNEGFLGEIQEYFGSDINLENYSLGDETNDFFTKVTGTDALILQKENYFSPFADASLYAIDLLPLPTNVSIISESTKTSINGYSANILDSSSLLVPGFTDSDNFNNKQSYIHTYSTESSNKSIQFPFAKDYPLIYLTPFANENYTQKETDSIIYIENFSESPVLDIGMNAIPGSITVYKNGIKEALFTYDSNTGLIKLTNTPNDFDEIRITWQENSETSTTGTLTSGIGYEYIISDNLNLNISSSFLWPILEKDSFTTNNSNTAGSANLAVKTEYKKNNLLVENILSTSFYTDDVTNAYQIDSMDSSRIEQKTLTKNAGIKDNETLVPVLQSRPNESTPQTELKLENKGKSTTETIRDASTSTYIIKNNWTIEKENGYIYQTIDFSGYATSLASSNYFSIALKQDLPSDYKMYLQLGVSNNDTIYETMNKIPTWELTSNDRSNVEIPFKTETQGWQTVSVILKDEDRAKLKYNQNARIVLVKQNPTSKDTGTLEIAHYELRGSGFSTVNQTIHSEEVYVEKSGKSQTDDMQRFNKHNRNIIQYFSWDDDTSPIDNLKAIKFYEPLRFSSYKYMSFSAYIPSIEKDSTIRLIFDTKTEYGTEKALDIILKNEALKQLENKWHTVSVDLYNKILLIDGIKINTELYEITDINTTIAPTRLELSFFGKAQLFIDEINLQETTWNLKTENNVYIDWNKNIILVGNEKTPIIANPSITSHSNFIANTPFEQSQLTNYGVTTENSAGIDILGIRTESTVQLTASNTKNSIDSISHKISSTPIFFPLQIINFSENYTFNPLSLNAKKNNSFAIKLLPLNLDFSTEFITQAQVKNKYYEQNVKISSNYNTETKNLKYNSNSVLQASQIGTSNKIISNNYFSSWLNISEFQFSMGIKEATKRETQFSILQEFSLKKINFEPKVVFVGENIFTNSNQIINSSSDSLQVEFPFSINKNEFSINFVKKSQLDSEITLSHNYVNDANNYLHSLASRKWAYSTIPIYDFFDKKITENMQTSVQSKSKTLATGYVTQIQANWERTLVFNPYDLIIPKNIDITIARDIRATNNTTSDFIQLSTKLNFLAFNNFGRFGYKNIFNWYEQDEIMQSLQFNYKFDKQEKSNWRLSISGYNQTTVYFTTNNTLRLQTEGQIDTSHSWNIKHSSKWERAGKTSFLVDGLYSLFPSIKAKNLGFNRSNTITVGFSNTENSIISQQYGINHNIDIYVHEFARIGLEFESDLNIKENALTMTPAISLIGKIEF